VLNLVPHITKIQYFEDWAMKSITVGVISPGLV
jgi:hypothetical protein